MTVNELINLLTTKNLNAEVQVRYETEVVYSELTSGTEERLVDLKEAAIFGEQDYVILAADLCEEKC